VLYEIVETDCFTAWRRKLKDLHVKDKVNSRIIRAGFGNFGDWKTEKGDIRAMRIDHGPGYRLYFVIRKAKIIFLLCGGDKRSQKADIERAVEIAKGVMD